MHITHTSLSHAGEPGALTEVPLARPPLVGFGTRMWWQQSEAVGRRRDRNGGPARLGKAKAVRTLARQAGRPVQHAGSGVEARSAQGQGSGAEEDRTRLLQAPRAEHANSRTAVCRGSMYVVRWVRCETGLFVRGTCAIWQWRRDKAGLPVCHSEVSASRLAGARVAGAGVGRPEARGLRRAPSIGHSRLRAWRERRARSAKGMRARCGGHWPSSRAVALSRMSGVIRRRAAFRAAVVFVGRIVDVFRRRELPSRGSFGFPERVCTSVRGSELAWVSGPLRVAPLGGLKS